ncbi:DMT family transporter [Burkholderiaceae bacterium FT117]|uniref:DMT family transporter n=1 Tax=Zeimonas sediminis TaxID=2944268 RepID=UPI0023431E30|nr:DMT family transporter [Zeimonas sediminis]MCM5570504.1 DMT family transporter [Zeimonas sediminis]
MSAPGGPASPAGLGRGLGAALFAVLVWGGQLPIAKGIFPALDGFSITVVRYGVAFLAFIPLLLWLEGVRAFVAHGRDFRLVFVAGLAMGASALLMITGLARTRPEIAVLILGLQPAMTAIADWTIWKKRPPAFTLACLALAFAGVAIAVTRGGDAILNPAPAVRGEALGNLLTFGAAVAWVSYVLITTRLHGWSTVRVSALTSGPAVAMVLIAWGIAWLAGATYSVDDLLPAATWRLAYVSLIGVVLAMFMWNFGARRIGAVNAVLLLNLMPVVTFAFRAAEGASFRTSEIVGAAIVVGALVANNLYLRRR